MTSKKEENEEVKIDEATQEKFNMFGQNLAAFELEVDKQPSSTLKKVMKVITGYPLAMNAEDINSNAQLSDKEKRLARIGCALKEQVINLFLEQQYNDLTTQKKENKNE